MRPGKKGRLNVADGINGKGSGPANQQGLDIATQQMNAAPKREPVDVRRLRELCDKAEPGPWTVVTHDGRKNIGIESAEVSTTDHGGVVANLRITAWKQNRRDARPTAAFIAAARTALPACLDEIEDLRKDKARLDWLENGDHDPKVAPFKKWDSYGGWVWSFGDGHWYCQIREAIDAAMRGEPKEGM